MCSHFCITGLDKNLSNKLTMGTTKYFGILAILALVFFTSCTNSVAENQMHVGMMNNKGKNMGNTQSNLSFFNRSINGLKIAEKTKSATVQNGQIFQMTAHPVVKNVSGNLIRMYGYNGQIPGPLIKVKQGSTIYVNFTNELDVETTIHWHGLRHDFMNDGVVGLSQESVKSEQSFLYKLSFPDAGIFWYHPHLREDLEQELGMYGNIIVEPMDENYYNPVAREITLFLDDLLINNGDIATFDPNKATFTLMGRFGNVILLD